MLNQLKLLLVCTFNTVIWLVQYVVEHTATKCLQSLGQVTESYTVSAIVKAK